MLFISLHLPVIGRQGEMINRLQADSAARIQVAPGKFYQLSFIIREDCQIATSAQSVFYIDLSTNL